MPHSAAASARPLAAPCLALAFFILLTLAGQALALAPTRLVASQPAARIENGQLSVFLSVTVDHEEGLRDMLKDGAVLELRLSMALERKRSFWKNAEEARKEYVSIMMHDPLSRDFIVLMPVRENEAEEPRELRDRNLTRLLYASWRALILPLADLENLDADEDASYAIDVDISLRHTDVPPWLEKSVIWSVDVVPSENISLPWRLPPPALTPQ